MVSREYTETVKSNLGSFPLKHGPVTNVLSVSARTSDGGYFLDYGKYFGKTDWTNVEVNHCVMHVHNGVSFLILPTSLFGTQYEEANIVYEAGVEQFPTDVMQAVDTMYKLLLTGEISQWNLFLPADVLDVIEKYRKGAVW